MIGEEVGGGRGRKRRWKRNRGRNGVDERMGWVRRGLAESQVQVGITAGKAERGGGGGAEVERVGSEGRVLGGGEVDGVVWRGDGIREWIREAGSAHETARRVAVVAGASGRALLRLAAVGQRTAAGAMGGDVPGGTSRGDESGLATGGSMTRQQRPSPPPTVLNGVSAPSLLPLIAPTGTKVDTLSVMCVISSALVTVDNVTGVVSIAPRPNTLVMRQQRGDARAARVVETWDLAMELQADVDKTLSGTHSEAVREARDGQRVRSAATAGTIGSLTELTPFAVPDGTVDLSPQLLGLALTNQFHVVGSADGLSPPVGSVCSKQPGPKDCSVLTVARFCAGKGECTVGPLRGNPPPPPPPPPPTAPPTLPPAALSPGARGQFALRQELGDSDSQSFGSSARQQSGGTQDVYLYCECTHGAEAFFYDAKSDCTTRVVVNPPLECSHEPPDVHTVEPLPFLTSCEMSGVPA